MNIFVILIVGLFASAKSDVGYQYKVPLTSYDAPFGSVGDLNTERNYYHVENQPNPSVNFVPVRPAPDLRIPIHEHTSFVDLKQFPQKTVSFPTTSQTTTDQLSNLPSVAVNKDTSTINLLGNSLSKNSYETEHSTFDAKSNFANENSQQFLYSKNSGNIALNSKSNFANEKSQHAEVEKHLYFYTAPEEPDEIQPKIITPLPPAKKNVKILFIKAPTFNTAPINIPALPQNEEKTLVYVLVKKPDQSSIIIPTPVPTKPTKPEVYFIKYKTHKEAQDAISNIQQNRNSGEVSTVNDNVFNTDTLTDHYIDSPHHVDLNQNINLDSKIPSSRNDGSITSDTPTLIPMSSFSTSFDASTLHEISGLSGPSDTQGYQLSNENHSGPTFSSSGLTNFKSSVNNQELEFVNPTTTSSLNLPSTTSEINEIHVHQVYGPPRTR